MGSLRRGWVAESGSRGGNGNAESGRWRVAGGPAAEVAEQSRAGAVAAEEQVGGS